MLSERSRNFIVGLTMLVALAAVMYGIFLLGSLPFLNRISTYTVTVVADQANGVAAGNKVDISGVEIGSVQSVELLRDPQTGAVSVKVKLAVNSGQLIPANAHAYLGKQTIGTGYVSIYADRPSKDNLLTDGSATLPGLVADSGLIPKEVFSDLSSVKDDLKSLSSEVKRVTDDLHILLTYNTPEDIQKADPKDPNRPRENIASMVVRLNRTVDSIDKLVSDPQLQTNVRLILQNMADASGQLRETLKSADKTIADIDATAKKFGDTATQTTASVNSTEKQITRVADKLVDTLDAIEKTTNALAKGDGTTSKLINDPRLYDSLLDLSKSLKSTVDDLNVLVRKWKDEGVNLKLK